jgi:hypothetical protein
MPIIGESIKAEGIEQIQRMLTDLTGPALKQAVRRAGRKIGTAIKVRMMRYPGRPNYPLRWASAKQRAWYFAARKADGLPVEYTRMTDPWSRQMKHSWDVKPHGEMGTIVGNRAPYSPYVVSSEYQTEMHADTGWPTDESVVTELDSSGVIIRTVMKEVETLIRRSLR